MPLPSAGTDRIGVDTGGTFTDFVWLDAGGRIRLNKRLSTPQNPAEAVLVGVAAIGEAARGGVVHGSTVATNALLERRGARTALITTAGFADVLAIGRQNRPDLYALVPQKPPPLVADAWRFEVAERVDAKGQVVRALDVADLDRVRERLAEEGIESVAVCLLFSFLYPEHEQRIRSFLLAEHETMGQAGQQGGLFVSLSSDILPEFREYERTSTTVINAYVGPLMSRYLEALQAGLMPRPLTVMQSNGGIISAAVAGRQAARTVLSGPAGGVVGARFAARAAGFDEVITFDMGGTSTDVALCPGRLPTTSEGEIDHMPLRLPMIDIHTVGAGGGSLAFLDAGGALHVGPQSAGANPGPACYGRAMWAEGGALPGATVTDANLILGRLDAAHFLGGEMTLDLDAARQSLDGLAAAMGVGSPERAAWGVIQVANANMERAIRRISVERGHDPRRTVLVAFGGAGPLHACDLAASLQIPQVLVPTAPGVLSALGMLVARPTRDYSQTVMRPLAAGANDSVSELASLAESLRQRGIGDMAGEGYGPAELHLQTSLDMRYVGQSFELAVPWAAGDDAAALLEGFHAAHRHRYGYDRPEAAVEVVNVRLRVEAFTVPPELPFLPPATGSASEAQIGSKEAWFDGRPARTRLYQRGLLRPGHTVSGPALFFQYDTTTVVPPEWQAQVDPHGQLVIRRIGPR